MKRKTMCYYIYKVLSSIYNSDISEIRCFNAPNTILLLLMLSSGRHCIILCMNKIWNNNCSDYYFIFCIVEWYNMRLAVVSYYASIHYFLWCKYEQFFVSCYERLGKFSVQNEIGNFTVCCICFCSIWANNIGYFWNHFKGAVGIKLFCNFYTFGWYTQHWFTYISSCTVVQCGMTF